MSEANAHCLAGVDVGKSNLRVAISDGSPASVDPVKASYAKADGRRLIAEIIEAIDAALTRAGRARGELTAIGVAVPAVIERATGRVIWGPDFAAVHGAAIGDELGAEFGVPVAVETDSTAATVGELWAGHGNTCDKLAVITWGTGIGAGLILHGEVYRDGNLFAEFGHMIVSDDPDRCICGASGCIGALVSGPAIARQAKRLMEQHPDSLLAEIGRGASDNRSSFACFEAARKGDTAARALLDRVGVLFGRLCANLVYTIQPRKIVFAGGLSDQLDAVIDVMDRTMRSSCWLLAQGLTDCQIVASDLRDTAGVHGAIRSAQLLRGEEAHP